MSSTRSHSDGSSGDEDELALCIALERSWVITGDSSGDEDELALRIALARSWVNTGGSSGDKDELALRIALERSLVKYGRQLRVRCDAPYRLSQQRRCRRRPFPPCARIYEACPICSSRPTASSTSGRCSARAALGSSARSADAADADSGVGGTSCPPSP